MNHQSRNNASHCVHGSIWCLGWHVGNKRWNQSSWPIADATTSQHPETRPFVCNFSRKRPLAEPIKTKGQAAKRISLSWHDCGGHFVLSEKNMFILVSILLFTHCLCRRHTGASHFLKDFNIKPVHGELEACLSISPLHAMLWEISLLPQRKHTMSMPSLVSSLIASAVPWILSPNLHTQWFYFLRFPPSTSSSCPSLVSPASELLARDLCTGTTSFALPIHTLGCDKIFPVNLLFPPTAAFLKARALWFLSISSVTCTHCALRKFWSNQQGHPRSIPWGQLYAGIWAKTPFPAKWELPTLIHSSFEPNRPSKPPAWGKAGRRVWDIGEESWVQVESHPLLIEWIISSLPEIVLFLFSTAEWLLHLTGCCGDSMKKCIPKAQRQVKTQKGNFVLLWILSFSFSIYRLQYFSVSLPSMSDPSPTLLLHNSPWRKMLLTTANSSLQKFKFHNCKWSHKGSGVYNEVQKQW